MKLRSNKKNFWQAKFNTESGKMKKVSFLWGWNYCLSIDLLLKNLIYWSIVVHFLRKITYMVNSKTNYYPLLCNYTCKSLELQTKEFNLPLIHTGYDVPHRSSPTGPLNICLGAVSSSWKTLYQPSWMYLSHTSSPSFFLQEVPLRPALCKNLKFPSPQGSSAVQSRI